MESLPINEFKFRAWSRKQAERFTAHIPDLIISDIDIRAWSDSGTDVIVTLQAYASLEQLHTILGGIENVNVIKKTLAQV